jgi:uncharacterized protein with HEPN domain
MNASDGERLQHMLDAAVEALSFLEGKTQEDLKQTRLLVLALTRELEIIGEAASRVSTECRTSLPGIPWPMVIGIRNRLIHVYFDVDLEIIWSTAMCDLPDLIRELERALRPHP